MKRSGISTAVLSSLLLAAPFIALLFLGWQWLGFAFVPFDLFDSISRILPGSVIPIGGIAHAGARGISRVEVRVDQEPWQEARLRTPLSGTTWVIWRFDWPFKAGRHKFTVRCFETNGTPQITAEAPPHPSGATGLHSLTARL